jgi:hypothetical protein
MQKHAYECIKVIIQELNIEQNTWGYVFLFSDYLQGSLAN